MAENSRSNNSVLFTFIVISSCVFLQYHLLVVSYGMVFVMIAILLRLIISKKTLVYDKDFFSLTVIICTQQIISALVLGYGKSHLLTNLIFIVFVFLISGVSQSIESKKSIVNCIILVSSICTTMVLIQAFEIYILGKNVNAIAILPLTEESALSWNNNLSRPCGLFSEPQTYCSYMAPLLFVLISEKKGKAAAFLSIGMIISGSSLGITITFIAWILNIISKETSKGKKMFLIIIGVIASLFFLNFEELVETRGKLKDIFVNFSTYSTGQMVEKNSYSNYLRIIKGWKTFIEMPFIDKFMGIGKDSFGVYLANGNITFSWYSIWDSSKIKALYYSSAAGIFIDYGLICGLIYYSFFLNKAIKSLGIERRIILLLIFEGFFTQISYNGLFVYYVLIIYLFSEVNRPFYVGFNRSRKRVENGNK